MSLLRVLLVEDHPLLREIARSLLSRHCTVIGTVERGDAVLATASDLRPDVVVLDISLPGQSGLQVLPELRRKYPRVGIVMLTSHDEPEYIDDAFRGGADSYVVKRHASEQLLPAVRNARMARSKDGA